MQTKRMSAGILAVLLILCLALTGCGNSDPNTNAGNTGNPSAGAESTPDGEDAATYTLPAGAESVYALYKTVLDYLNNGFHDADLKDVCDPNLTLVFYSKWEERPERNFTLGLQYAEACALMAKLLDIASKMDMLVDEDGWLEDDLIDYHPFQEAYPESMQAQIVANREYFEDFISEQIVGYVYNLNYNDRDGQNPFRTDQTVWEVKSEDELEIEKYHSSDWDEDMYVNFPQVYHIDIGDYRSGNDVYGMGFYYTQIDGRYYCISFSTVWGTAGG